MDCKLKHTPCPEGYLQWHAWAARMSKSFTCKKCPVCGLWAIWVPKMVILVDCPKCGVSAGTECQHQIYPLRGSTPHKERRAKAKQFKAELLEKLQKITKERTAT
jgi:hypothetical protein